VASELMLMLIYRLSVRSIAGLAVSVDYGRSLLSLFFYVLLLHTLTFNSTFVLESLSTVRNRLKVER